jgi:hypothetical protein
MNHEWCGFVAYMNRNKDVQMELQKSVTNIPNLENGQSLDMNSC